MQYVLGLHQDTYVTPLKKISSKSLSHSNDNVYNQQTPVRVCRIPPCRSKLRFKQPEQIGTQVSMIGRPAPGGTESCSCSPEKLMELFEKAMKEMSSIGVGDTIPLVRQPAKDNLMYPNPTCQYKYLIISLIL